MATTAAARALKERQKNRTLPTVEVPIVEGDELARMLQGVQEHLRMYEGDSGAPKERFVTIAELENTGLIKADVKGRFAYVSQVLGRDVSQKAGSTYNPTQKDTVGTDTSRTGRVPDAGGSGAQGSVSTTARLNDSQDVNVANPAKNEFLYYNGNKFTNFALFKNDNAWVGRNRFDKPVGMLDQAAGPEALLGLGYLWMKTGTPNTLWYTDNAGTETQLGGYLTSVAVSDLDNGTDGELITWDASGVAAVVAVGTATHVLTSNGVGAAPTFQAAPGGAEVNDLSSVVTWANIPIANVPTGTSSSTVALGDHLHAGVYEPVDATIVRTGDAAWNASDWDTAFGWGDHASGGYAALTGASFTGKVTVTAADAARWAFTSGTDYLNLTMTAGAASFVATSLSNIVFSGATRFRLGMPMAILESAAETSNVAAYGQFWVKNDVPNIPMFTDDTDISQLLDPSASEINSQTGSYTLLITDKGKTIHKPSGGAGETITIPANASVAYKLGTLIGFQNDGGGDLSIAITTDTLTGTDGATGTRTLGDNHTAVIQKMTATTWKYAASDL